MDKKAQKNTAAETAAINEENIKGLDILQELEPLLKEYFIGDFEIKGNTLNLKFKNGQSFRLAACEVC